MVVVSGGNTLIFRNLPSLTVNREKKGLFVTWNNQAASRMLVALDGEQ